MVSVRNPLGPSVAQNGIRLIHGGPGLNSRPKQALSLQSAYRQLLRVCLQAVRFSSPARYQIRNILRDSFRNSPPAAFNPRRIQNTILFLEQAREHNGFEHKILRNILHVRYWRENPKKDSRVQFQKQNNEVGLDLRRNVPGQFDATLTVFNESMGLCLRV